LLAGSTGILLAGCDAPPPTAAPPSAGSVPPKPVRRQPGITDTPTTHCQLVALDVTAADRAGLADTLGRLVGFTGATVSVGASLFDDRFGLADRRPRGLVPMPAFPSDVLDGAWCHGDLTVQVAADTAEGVTDAADEVDALPGLRTRWRMPGFRLDNGVDTEGKSVSTNLFGFREGTGNPVDPDEFIWTGDDEPPWARGGTYQVVRLIRFAMSLWDADPVPRQESIFGRRKDTNAPLGRERATDEPDYAADPTGNVIALDAHIRRANPRTPETQANRVLRRSYSYRRPADEAGHEDAGLLFICYQRNIERGFAAIQRRLEGEALQKYLLPFGGGYYFTPSDGDLVRSLVL
jgi:deferrochelatase/peroxidase EfeB